MTTDEQSEQSLNDICVAARQYAQRGFCVPARMMAMMPALSASEMFCHPRITSSGRLKPAVWL
jgi:hypothetical protein